MKKTNVGSDLSHHLLLLVRWHLRCARGYARAAKAPRLVAKIQSAIKSAGGSIRHAEHMADRRRRAGRT